MRILTKSLTLVFIVVLITTMYYQYDYQNYIKNQKNKYGILKNRERIKCKLALISFVENNFIVKASLNKRTSHDGGSLVRVDGGSFLTTTLYLCGL